MKRTLPILTLVVALVAGCGKKDRRAGQVEAPTYEGAKVAVQEEKTRQPLPWVVNRPPTDQKPIHGLPLTIEIDAPEAPEKIATPAPIEE